MIGSILRGVLKKKGLTYRKVSEDLGIDHASLHRSLKKGGNPEWNTVTKILNYLGYDFKLIKRREVKLEKSKSSRPR